MFDDFDAIIQAMGDLPPVPAVATKVMQLLENPMTSVKLLAKTIGSDPVVSARILKVANSALYYQQKQVNSLDKAIVLLGENTIKSIVFESCLQMVNRNFGFLQKEIWENSMGCAIAARIVADALDAPNPDEAFLAGLFRHVGKLLMVNRHPDAYRQVLATIAEGGGDLVDVERGVFAYSHDQVGAAILENWNFPSSLVQSTLHHHHLGSGRELPAEIYQLTAMVKVAGSICYQLGVGGKPPDKTLALEDSEGARVLDLEAEELEEILEEFKGTFKRESDFFILHAKEG